MIMFYVFICLAVLILGTFVHYLETGKTPWSLLTPRKSVLLPANNEKDLERWHDAYDAAILEGKDEVEAVRCADTAAPKQGSWESFYPSITPYARALTKNEIRRPAKPLWYHTLNEQRNDSRRPLPGEPGGMGAIEAAGNGTIKLRWDGLTLRMTTEEWIRQGRPGAQEAITGVRNPFAPPILGDHLPASSAWQDPVIRGI